MWILHLSSFLHSSQAFLFGVLSRNFVCVCVCVPPPSPIYFSHGQYPHNSQLALIILQLPEIAFSWEGEVYWTAAYKPSSTDSDSHDWLVCLWLMGREYATHPTMVTFSLLHSWPRMPVGIVGILTRDRRVIGWTLFRCTTPSFFPKHRSEKETLFSLEHRFTTIRIHHMRKKN